MPAAAQKTKASSKSTTKSSAKPAPKVPASSSVKDAPDAVTLLKADHRLVEKLFSDFKDAKASKQKEKIAAQICLELTVHTIIEEEIFYPACRKAGVEGDLLDESYVEHDGAKVLIAEIMGGAPKENFYEAKVQVLSEDIEHHVKEEERFLTGMFAQAKRKDLDLQQLGQQMFARKQELQKTFKKEGLSAPETRTMIGAELTYGSPVEGKKAA